MWRIGRGFIIFWLAGVSAFTLAAAVDVIWQLGWDYRPRDVLIGCGMLAFGGVFWFIWNWWFPLMRRFNEYFYGPDQEGK